LPEIEKFKASIIGGMRFLFAWHHRRNRNE
jgi:hypothetical protein